MALPNPNPNQQPQQFGASYQPFSAREAIGTRAQAAFLQMQANLLERSPLLRMIPGSSTLRERAEFKKRELYERTGRDPNTGRKLTKDEVADREAKKYERGALGEIRDLYVDEYGETGVPVILKKDSDALFLFERIDANILIIKDILSTLYPSAANRAGGPISTLDDVKASDDALRAEEMAAEQEAEDDQDQLESEQRQQGFFTKLFKGGLFGSRDRNQSGGLLSGLMSLLSPLISGGVSGFLSALITPILGVLGTALTSLVGLVVPLLAAIAPALPVIAGAMLAGGAALLIYNWMKDKLDKEEAASFKQSMDVASIGAARKTAQTATGEKVYEVSDKEGNTKFATAKELNLSEEQTKQLATGDFVTTDAGQIRESTYKVETKRGKETGKLAEGMNANELMAANIAKGETTIEQANAMSRGEQKLMEVERKMQEYSSSFSDKITSGKDNSAQTLALVDDFNRIARDLASGQKNFPEIFTPKKIEELTQSKYRLFQGISSGGVIDPEAKAEIDKDDWFGISDEMDADKVVLPGLGKFDVGSKMDARTGSPGATNENPAYIKMMQEKTGTNIQAPDKSVPITTATPTPAASVPVSTGEARPSTPMDIPSAAAENATLRSAPPVVAPTNNTVANVSNNNSATIVGPVSASRGTGVDMDSGYNGGGFRLSYSG